MLTRSNILIQQPDNTYLGIYCHWDGDLSLNGCILNACYQNREKVEALISLGDISQLGETLEPANQEKTSCVAYGRDKGYKDTKARIYRSLDCLNDFGNNFCEFNYVYGLDNSWRYFETGELENGLLNLNDAIKAIQNENIGGASK